MTQKHRTNTSDITQL